LFCKTSSRCDDAVKLPRAKHLMMMMMRSRKQRPAFESKRVILLC
jgi:hypothetical protein